MKKMCVTSLLLMLVCAGTMEGAVIKIPLVAGSSSGDKAEVEGGGFWVPVTSGLSYISASVVVDVDCEGPVEVGSYYSCDDVEYYSDQLSIQSPGEHVFDLTRGVRVAQANGLQAVYFELRSMEYDASKALPRETIGIGNGYVLLSASRYFGDGLSSPNEDDGLNLPDDNPRNSGGLSIRVFPSPFNPRVTIRINHEDPGSVQADVYDIRGRHLISLCNEEFNVGPVELVWDGRDSHGRDVSSGHYLVRVKSNHKSAVGRMVLVR